MGDARVKTTKLSSLLTLIGVGTMTLSAGCSGVPGADGGSGAASGQENLGTKSSALVNCGTCNASNVTTFTVNNSTVTGPSVSTHVCFASEFQGRSNFAVSASLIVDQLFGNWVVQGFGKMSCVPLCCFRHPSPSAVRWVSQTFATDDAAGCPLEHTNMWWGDAAGWVQGLRKGNGSIEGFTRVDEFAGAFTPRQLHAENSCDPGFVGGWGQSFFVGVPSSGVQAKLSSGFATWVQNPSVMISQTQGICYFTSVGAFLPGAGRKATIQLEGGNWVLRGTGSSSIQAAAQCMFYQQ